MNLFKEETQQVLEKFVSKDWAEQLSQYIDIDAFETIRKTIKQKRSESIVYPESNNIFKALNYSFEKVKVVIVGQDPYHNGNADGLAFSCKESLSPSLAQIIRAIWKDELEKINIPFATGVLSMYLANIHNWNLEYLAQQGVLLYNPTLTVEAGKPGSHKGIWSRFTEAVFSSVYTKENLVVMMWGKEAQDAYNKTIRNNNTRHLLLTNEHPAAASYAKRTWKCNHFTECNKWLRDKNLTEIEWIQR